MLAVTLSTGGDPSHAAARRAYTKADFEEKLTSVHPCRSL
jgi:hypothetical protein